MNFLIYGSKGHVGGILTKFLERENINFIEGISICDNYEDVNEEIKKINPTNVICCIGKSFSKSMYSQNLLETKLNHNIKDNLYSKLVLMKCCSNNNIHFTHIGDGCIFNSCDSIIAENDLPNLDCSSHAIIKTYFQKLLMLLGDNYLNIRLSHPISGDFNPKCFISKIISYDKIINKNVSISILDDIIPILIDLIIKKTIGTYNLTNPGYINLLDLKIMCKEYIDINLKINEISEKDHNSLIGIRSHNIFDTSKIESEYKIDNVSISLNRVFEKMNYSCRQIKKCLCCLSNNKTLIDLNYQPLANDFHIKGVNCQNYPLRLMYCENCYHCQLSHSVDPEILFKDYKYVSGTSETGLKFFKDNAKYITNCAINKFGKILDIACNDGSQLDFFKEIGWETFGVDPAANLCPIAESKGHRIICDFWNFDSASKLPKMDVILAQNVFAHTQYIDDFLQNCKLVMDFNTILFIQTSQKDMIINGEFDTCYHEHISFFNSKSMKILVERNGLKLNKVIKTSIHGGSYIFEISLNDINYNTNEVIDEEEKIKLYNISTYEKFNLNAKRTVENLKIEIEKYRNDYKIIGFGAAAKGQTVLCYGNIDLDYIIDENKLKIGLYSPKMNIPIVGLNYFKEDKAKKILIVILAWNFADEIISKINENKGDREIIIIKGYFPNLILIK
jgi:dTDP-4-dehydrorhamnose reductase/2-polyprenyl-3-methyl-5-hydroxy-6-metoxy-1,4-benzoquinol methylase